MPKNRKLQNIIGTEHITDAAEAAIAAQASGGATVAFKNVAVSGQDNVVADAETDTLTLVGGSNVTITTDASADSVTIAATGGSPGGSDGQIQFNNGGSFGGDANFTFDDTANAEKVILEANSSETLLRITQEGEGHALVVEDSTNPDSSPFVINKYGKVGIGENAVNNSYALSTDATGNIRFGTNGFITGGRFLGSQNKTASEPMISRLTDTNTGIFFPGADQLGFSTGGTERLRFGSAGQIGIAGANYGTSGQVLTSQGASAAPQWAAAGGGGQTAHTPQLAVDFYANTAGVTVYPLLASGQSANDTTNTGWLHTVSTTKLVLWPCIAAKTGTINGLQVRTGSTAGDDLHIALYKSDSDGLPNGAAAFSTTITPSANTSYTPTISVSGVTKGDILYFATFGQVNRTNLRVIDVTDGGTFVVPRTVGSVNYSVGGPQQVVELSGQTNGVFPTLSSTTAYDGTGEPDYVPRIGITYS